MLNGLFESAMGMKVRLSIQEIIANNLANAGTAGFQREIASIHTQYLRTGVTRDGVPGAPPEGWSGAGGAATAAVPPDPADPGGILAEFLDTQSAADLRQGPLHDTHAPADVALDGTGYLVVRTREGERLIRGGSMRPNVQGQLGTSAGDPLLSTDGTPITVGDRTWKVAADGTVSADGETLGRLRIVRASGDLRREGAQLMATQSLRDAPVGSVRVLQGFLEHSNVDPVREMVEMIAGVRAYETAQRAFLAQDQTLQSLLDVVRR